MEISFKKMAPGLSVADLYFLSYLNENAKLKNKIYIIIFLYFLEID